MSRPPSVRPVWPTSRSAAARLAHGPDTAALAAGPRSGGVPQPPSPPRAASSLRSASSRRCTTSTPYKGRVLVVVNRAGRRLSCLGSRRTRRMPRLKRLRDRSNNENVRNMRAPSEWSPCRALPQRACDCPQAGFNQDNGHVLLAARTTWRQRPPNRGDFGRMATRHVPGSAPALGRLVPLNSESPSPTVSCSRPAMRASCSSSAAWRCASAGRWRILTVHPVRRCDAA